MNLIEQALREGPKDMEAAGINSPAILDRAEEIEKGE